MRTPAHILLLAVTVWATMSQDTTGDVVIPFVSGTVAPTTDSATSLSLINRFRADPQGELARMLDLSPSTLATSITASSGPTAGDGTNHSSGFWAGLAGPSASATASAMDYFEVHPGDLWSQWNSLPTTGSLAPLAWNGYLGNSSRNYNELLIDDAGATANPHAVSPYDGAFSERFTDSGYTNWNSLGENIFRNYVGDLDYAHAGYAVDWGSTANGIQDPAGHRDSMLSTGFREAGIDVQASYDTGRETMTQHFGAQFDDNFLAGYIYQSGAEYTFDNATSGATVEVRDSTGSTILASTTADAWGGYVLDLTGLGLVHGQNYLVVASSGANSSSQLFSYSSAATMTQLNLQAVPEPSSLVLVGIVFAAMAWWPGQRGRKRGYCCQNRPPIAA